MSTRTQTSSSPFSRLSLIGKAAQSPSPRARDFSKRAAADDDYIPYTGPYEEPPRRRQERSRDSWGDPLYDEDGNNMIQELHQRYVPPDDSQYPWREEDEERKGRPRARTHSGVSGRTISSGTVDPHRTSVSVLRKASHHANVPRPPVPSYINLDAAGGVGESPAPPSRFSRETPPPKRSSLASIFTFGHASKKLPLSPAKVALPTSPPAPSPLANAKYSRAFATELPRPASGPPSIYSVSSDKHQSSHASHEGDTYHSYYNYTPAADPFCQLSSPQNATPPPHPYAYNTPQRDIPDPPQTAPLVMSPKLKFIQPTHRLALPQQEATALPPHVRSLKTYASTPNLRDASASPNRLRKQAQSPTKGKDRWLSAETWCDAIMFPRPRLKVEDAQLLLRGASGRIVSPPGSPVIGGFDAPQNPDRPAGMASRVLAHSRSMVSLNAEAGTSKMKNGVVFRGLKPEPLPPFVPPPPILLPTETERPPRPKSFAWDDLALPSPVPSLARVLEEGQILEHQRKKWQMQATGSFQNTRARSLSRARAKSLTQKGGRAGQSNMDFLAARSFLGNQDVVPVLPVRLHSRTASQSGTNTNGTSTFNTRTSRTSHSHSNSLVKTVSKSSHGHSRQGSWGRSAFNKAAALCYPDGVPSPADEKANGLETALRTGGTKVIRLADPAQIPIDNSGPLSALSRNGVSPTPSAVSDARMGIALGTPPPTDSNSFERESIHLPSHPYAQGGVSYPSYQPVVPVVAKGAEYAGPHPAVAVVNPNPQDFSARHRLPPQASLTHHPYASPSSRRESYQIVPRTDSDVPAPSKMWAQLSPGIVREILPGEILYSPFMSERSTTPEEQRETNGYGQNRKSTATILDTVGLGETLAYAVEEENSRDSGLGTSEDHAPNAEEWGDDGQAAAVEAHHPYRIHRKPVQYDISRPPYTPKKTGASSNTNHTAGSSPVDPTVSHEHRLTPPTPPLPSNPSPGVSSMHSTASSPPRSPPPIGSVDDLDDFRDLFYKPHLTDDILNNLSRPTSSRQPSVTWDLASTTRTQRTRTGSGLTSLARQLSQEFEEMRAVRHRARTDSMGSDSSISRFSGFPTEHDIQFVFSESEMARSIGEGPVRPALPQEAMSAFRPSGHLPEDVESSRTSSPIDRPLDDEEEHEIRVGHVESVSTPPATSSNYRSSYTGQMSFPEEHAPKGGIPIPRVVSSLQPHSADPTRSSYMTESTLSRMSNLSDFPAPPPQHMTPAHMSLLSSYFHEAVAERAIPENESAVTFSPRIGERF